MGCSQSVLSQAKTHPQALPQQPEDTATAVEYIYRLLRGDFSAEVIEYVSKLIPSAKIMVFLSSTFTDTYEERNDLM